MKTNKEMIEERATELWAIQYEGLIKDGVKFPDNFDGIGAAYGGYARIIEALTKHEEAVVERIEKKSSARYIADLYKIRGHFMPSDLMSKPGQLEISINYTIITIMISHLMDKYDLDIEDVKEELYDTHNPTSNNK